MNEKIWRSFFNRTLGRTIICWIDAFEGYNTVPFLDAVKDGWAVPLPAAEKNVQEIFTRFNDYMTEMLSTGEIESNLEAMEAEFNELLK